MNYQDIAVSDAVIVAIDGGRDIEAIRILCEQTGIGFEEARAKVDQIAHAQFGAPEVQDPLA